MKITQVKSFFTPYAFLLLLACISIIVQYGMQCTPSPTKCLQSRCGTRTQTNTGVISHTHTHTPPSTPYNNYDNSFGAFCIYNSDVIVVAAAAPLCRHIGISCPLTPTSPQTYCERQIYRASKQPHVNLNLLDSMKIFLAE